MTSRREWLSSLGIGAFSATGLNAALRAEDSNNLAANVADKTSTIKITKLTATPVMGKVFLKIETNHGVTGWGEIDQLEPYVAATLARSLFELLDGENPTRIEHLWQKIYRSHRDMRGGPFMTHTLAGIDMALWDITGKLWGVPVYRLLGGPTRDKVRFYPTPSATKIGVGPQPFSGTPQQIEAIVKSVEDARTKVGPGRFSDRSLPCASSARTSPSAEKARMSPPRTVLKCVLQEKHLAVMNEESQSLLS